MHWKIETLNLQYLLATCVKFINNKTNFTLYCKKKKFVLYVNVFIIVIYITILKHLFIFISFSE